MRISRTGFSLAKRLDDSLRIVVFKGVLNLKIAQNNGTFAHFRLNNEKNVP